MIQKLLFGVLDHKSLFKNVFISFWLHSYTGDIMWVTSMTKSLISAEIPAKQAACISYVFVPWWKCCVSQNNLLYDYWSLFFLSLAVWACRSVWWHSRIQKLLPKSFKKKKKDFIFSYFEQTFPYLLKYLFLSDSIAKKMAIVIWCKKTLTFSLSYCFISKHSCEQK